MDTAGGRLLRALAVAVITIGLSALAHVAAGGALPAPAGLLGIVILAAAATFPLFRSSIARRALVPLLAMAQSALHPLFSLAARAPWSDAPQGGPHISHHSGPSLAMAHESGWSPAMWLAHLGSAVVAASVVVFVDHVLVELIAEHLWWLPKVPPEAQPTGPEQPLVPAVATWRGLLSDLVDQAPRRGPPSTVAA